MSKSQFNRKVDPNLISWLQEGVDNSVKKNPINPVWRNVAHALTVALLEFCEKYFPELRNKYLPKNGK